MVKKIIQKLTIIFALIFVFIPKNTYAYVYEFEGKKADIYPSMLHTDWPGDWTNLSNFGSHVFATQDTSRDFWTPEITFNAFSLKTNDYVVLEYSTYSQGEIPGSCLTGYGVWDVVDCQHDFQRIDYQSYVSEWWAICHTTNNNLCEYEIRPNDPSDVYSNSYLIDHYRYILRFGGTSLTNATKIKLGGTIISSTISNNHPKFVKFSPGAVFEHGAMINDILTFLEENNEAEEMKRDKEESQQQGQQSQTNSNQAGGDVQQNTTSVLNAITGFFSAFTNARPTNCNMDWGLEDYGFGVINMCQNPIPQEFQVVLSIVSLLFVVPMILWLFSSIINAFKEFQS